MATTDLVTLAEVKTQLNITVSDHDTRLAALITNTSARILAYLQTAIVHETVTEKHFGGKKRIYLKKYPYVSDIAIIDGDGNTVPSTDYLIIAEEGILQHVGLWPTAEESDGKIGRWSITFKAGLAAATASVQGDIKDACHLWISKRFSRPDPSITSKSVGDMSLSYAILGESADGAPGVPPDVAQLLAPYVSRGF